MKTCSVKSRSKLCGTAFLPLFPLSPPFPLSPLLPLFPVFPLFHTSRRERIALGTCSDDFNRRSHGTATEVATTSAHNASWSSVGLSQTRDAPVKALDIIPHFGV
jgi:hypothetical protein